jgi:hypothetical protein
MIEMYRCPLGGLSIDHWCEPAEKPDTYEAVTCRACNRMHLVNLTSGRVLDPARDETRAANHAKT